MGYSLTLNMEFGGSLNLSVISVSDAFRGDNKLPSTGVFLPQSNIICLLTMLISESIFLTCQGLITAFVAVPL